MEPFDGGLGTGRRRLGIHLTENIFGETGQQVTENLLILSLPDNVVRIGCSFILSFGIFLVMVGDGGVAVGWMR
jgi:hypothetical protein